MPTCESCRHILPGHHQWCPVGRSEARTDVYLEGVGLVPPTQVEDQVNHPSHYTAYRGLEIIDLTEQMNFNRGNAVKYIARAGLKNKATEVQDLEKAVWYLQREIQRIQQ